ncbi:hypothetical protein PIB30_014154 [Stylosanthes scabra]|uniref:Uncharacterized protein n=1 Tax=Stylosanthes scabra TaxID=79078 RepID=A0ABU6U993_9FABA|nr:hypothetical protein [Stylosanthes scabra]
MRKESFFRMKIESHCELVAASPKPHFSLGTGELGVGISKLHFTPACRDMDAGGHLTYGTGELGASLARFSPYKYTHAEDIQPKEETIPPPSPNFFSLHASFLWYTNHVIHRDIRYNGVKVNLAMSLTIFMGMGGLGN